MIPRIADFCSRFIRTDHASVALHVGLLLTIVIGMVALGTEITFLLYKQRQMQSAADSAALGSATAISSGHPADFTLEARAISGSLGFVHGTNGVTITVNRPPVSGFYVGSTSAVQVVLGQPQTLHMVTLFKLGPFNVRASSVALTSSSGNYCVLQLNAGSSPGVTINNGAVVNLTQCSLAVDSGGGTALSVTGGATLNALAVSASGAIVTSNGGRINAINGTKTYQPAVPDPYASVAPPSYSGCNFNNKSLGHASSTQYLSPGIYCNGLSMGNDAVVVMNPGVYIIDRGSFQVGGAVRLTGTGVTIFLTSSTRAGYATTSIGNGASVTLTAPTTGATAGLVFFGDRSASLATTSNFGGGATENITGAIYLPSQTMSFSNGTSNPSGCTQLIAGVIQFTGGSQFKNNCASTGVVAIGATKSTLVE